MMEAKHTPNDLADHDLFQCERCGSICDIEDSVKLDGGLFCADCTDELYAAHAANLAWREVCHINKGDENALPDAALIAASPDLLAIAKALDDWWREGPTTPISPFSLQFEDDEPFRSHVRQAVLKAEGGQQ